MKRLSMMLLPSFGIYIVRRKHINRLEYLNLGCGRNIIAGFDNADTYRLRNWKSKHIGVDLAKVFPFQNHSYKGIFFEHTLEHLRYDTAIKSLLEIKRVLVPGGVVRIVVPDLDLYLKNINLKHADFEFQIRFKTSSQMIWNLTQNWGHKSVWNFEILKEILKFVGFKNISRVTPFKSYDENLLVDQQSRFWESLYVEAKK